VAAQTDRGTCSLTPKELKAFCQKHGIVGPIATSAATGAGVEELVERMKSTIHWEDKAVPRQNRVRRVSFFAQHRDAENILAKTFA